MHLRWSLILTLVHVILELARSSNLTDSPSTGFRRRGGVAIRDAMSESFKPMNIQRIADFYITILGSSLLKSAEHNETANYMAYFDESLRHYVRHVFERISGFAANMTQANVWHRLTHEFFHLYALRTFAEQAEANLEAYIIYHEHAKLKIPWSLLKECVCAVNVQLKTTLREVHLPLHITDSILFYELARVTNLPVVASSVNSAPYLRISYDYKRRRYMGRQPSQLDKFSHHIIPYSPLQNLDYELKILSRACLKVQMHSLAYTLNNTYLKKYVESSLLNKTEFFMEQLVPGYPAKLKCSIISFAFFDIVVNFLHAEYRSLVCHPLFHEAVKESTFIIDVMQALKKIVYNARVTLVMAIESLKPDQLLAVAGGSDDGERSTQLNFTYVRESIRTFLWQHCFFVQYSDYASGDIVISEKVINKI